MKLRGGRPGGLAGLAGPLLSCLFLSPFVAPVDGDKATDAATRYQLQVYTSPNFQGKGFQIKPNSCSRLLTPCC